MGATRTKSTTKVRNRSLDGTVGQGLAGDNGDKIDVDNIFLGVGVVGRSVFFRSVYQGSDLLSSSNMQHPGGRVNIG